MWFWVRAVLKPHAVFSDFRFLSQPLFPSSTSTRPRKQVGNKEPGGLKERQGHCGNRACDLSTFKKVKRSDQKKSFLRRKLKSHARFATIPRSPKVQTCCFPSCFRGLVEAQGSLGNNGRGRKSKWKNPACDLEKGSCLPDSTSQRGEGTLVLSLALAWMVEVLGKGCSSLPSWLRNFPLLPPSLRCRNQLRKAKKCGLGGKRRAAPSGKRAVYSFGHERPHHVPLLWPSRITLGPLGNPFASRHRIASQLTIPWDENRNFPGGAKALT